MLALASEAALRMAAASKGEPTRSDSEACELAAEAATTASASSGRMGECESD